MLFQPFCELFGVAHKAVPELMLPAGTFCFAQFVDLEGRLSLDVLKDIGNR